MRKNILLLCLISLLILLTGCGVLLSSRFGPGYFIDIDIRDNAALSNDDIVYLEMIAQREQFNRVKEVKLSNEEMIVYYYRELKESSFNKIYHKAIDIDFIYYKKEGDKNKVLKEIKILNDAEGYSEPLKTEIDRIAKLFEDALKERIGAEYVRIERARTGPPF